MFKHGFPPEWSTFKKLIWLVGSGIAGAASGIWKTVTGTLIHLTDALASPMQKCEVTLEPVQDLHGQDAPYPAGGGVNKFDGEFESGTFNQTTGQKEESNFLNRTKNPIPASPSTSYYLLRDDGSGRMFYYASDMSLLSTEYVSEKGTFTTPSNCYYLNFTQAIALSTDNVAVNYPSSVTAYSPYSNICPITGWTGASVTRTGKNLFDKNNASVINAYLDNGKIVGNSSHRVIYIKCLPNTTYTVQKIAVNVNDRLYIAYCNELPANNVNVYGLTGKGASFTVGDKYSYSVTTGADAKYVVVWVSTASDYNASITTMQIEVGSSATDYEAFNGTTLSVTFPDGQTVYGGTVDLVSGVLTVLWKSVEAQTLTWVARTGSMETTISDRKYGTDIYPLSSHYKGAWISGWANLTDGMIGAISNYIIIRIKDDAHQASLADWNNYLTAQKTAGTPVQILYELAEPIEISLTPQEISTLKGVNNVWSDANGDITLIYKAQAE